MSIARRKIGPLTFDIPAVFVGLHILIKGLDKLEGFEHHPVIVTSLLLLGAFVLVAAFLPLWLKKRWPNAHAFFHLAEGIAITLSAILLFEKGRLRIPIILLGAGLLYAAAGYLESRTLERRRQLAGPMLAGIGWFILAGGVILAGFTVLGDRDCWAFGASGLFVVMGVALLLARPWLLARRWPSDHVEDAGSAPPAD
jgi:hydrogenase/urease accessory protein HupE